MHVTTAICTFNRCGLLRQTLESLTGTFVPPDLDWEVLVVDNNSTDDTPDVVREFEARLPVRRVLETRQGLSNARNRAASEAVGEYILWIDDDVVVSKRWLEAYVDAFARWPDAAFFGGPIEPLFEGTPPRWLSEGLDEVWFVYALRELGAEPFRFEPEGPLPYGANYAVRREVQMAHAYDPRLGRRGERMGGDEETTLFTTLLAGGHEGRWVPAARLRHFIPTERQTIGHIRRYMMGKGKMHQNGAVGEREFEFMGRPLWVWRQAVVSEIKFRVLRWTRASSRRWLSALKEASFAEGIISSRR